MNLIYFSIRSFRTFFLRRKENISIGTGSVIDIESTINALNGGRVCIESNVLLRGRKNGYHAGMPFGTTLLSDASGSLINVGNNCRINGAYIHAQKKITIGNSCVIASGVNIIDSNGHVLFSNDRTIGRDEPKEIVIGNNVWIGLNCIILKGTNIGDNSVVAAGSVVKGDFPANSLIQGNPAVVMKTLNI